MAFSVNETSIPSEAITEGVSRQRLLTRERVVATRILLDRFTLAAGARAPLAVADGDVAWFQILEGAVRLVGGDGSLSLNSDHIAFLPPGYRGSLCAESRAALLYASVPEAVRLDPAFAQKPPSFRVVDWTREPVLDSQHDARKRVYVVTPKLFDTRAIKGEMIIYPPGTAGANHHHEGAEHFMYVLRGQGTAHANDRAIPVRTGDLIYYDDFERHWLRNEGSEEMAFVEFFVPGVYKTVWAEGASVCTWLPTGRDIRGQIPVREIRAHSGADETSPADV